MLTLAIAIVGALFLAVLTIMTVFMLGMRAKSPFVLRAVRRINRAIFNPRQMRSAGTPGAYASVIRHRGRTSGRDYETPVGAVPSANDFVIALPYGTDPDWLKNVLASGSAVIVHEGRTFRVDEPEVVSMDAAAGSFSDKDQRSHRLFRVNQCLRVVVAM